MIYKIYWLHLGYCHETSYNTPEQAESVARSYQRHYCIIISNLGGNHE